MSTAQSLKAVATGQASPATAKDVHAMFKDQLERTKPQLMGLMGNSRANVEAFCSVLERAVMENPALLSADRKSLFSATLKCAQAGLMPDGREAVFNLRNTKVRRPGGREEWVDLVVYEPMVAGYIKNLYDHPDVLLVDSAAVYANDHFRFVRGDAPRLEHEPTMTNDPGPIIAAYLVVHLKNGQIKREVMPKRDIDKAKNQSKSTGANSPWTKWEDQMAIKSVIKRGAKQLPRSNKFESMERHDNEALAMAGAHTGETLLPPPPAQHAPAPQQLEHQPGETLEFDIDGATGEILEHEEIQQQPTKQQAAPLPTDAPAPAPKAQPEGLEAYDGPTYAVLADRLHHCSDPAIAELVLDEGRDLPEVQQADLRKLFDDKFPPALETTGSAPRPRAPTGRSK